MIRIRNIEKEEIQVGQILVNYSQDKFFVVVEVDKEKIIFRRENKTEGEIRKEDIFKVETLDFTVLAEKKMWLAEQGKKSKADTEASFFKIGSDFRSEIKTNFLFDLNLEFLNLLVQRKI